VTGAGRYRNPDDDLPKDFEARRGDYYAELRKPLDPKRFVAELREEMERELAALNDGLPNLGWVEIADRGRQGPIGPRRENDRFDMTSGPDPQVRAACQRFEEPT